MRTLQEKPDDELLDEKAAAELLGLKNKGTLSVWRYTNRYPLPYCRIGRNIRYRKSAVLAFIASRTVSA